MSAHLSAAPRLSAALLSVPTKQSIGGGLGVSLPGRSAAAWFCWPGLLLRRKLSRAGEHGVATAAAKGDFGGGAERAGDDCTSLGIGASGGSARGLLTHCLKACRSQPPRERWSAHRAAASCSRPPPHCPSQAEHRWAWSPAVGALSSRTVSLGMSFDRSPD